MSAMVTSTNKILQYLARFCEIRKSSGWARAFQSVTEKIAGKKEWNIPGVRDYVRTLGWNQSLLLYAGRVLGLRVVRLKIRGMGSSIWCRPATSDFYALGQVFISRDSDHSLDTIPRLIIDAGANVGYASVLFANKYPKTQVIAVEPDRENCVWLRRNCESLPNVRVVQGGIWRSHSHLRIVNPDSDSWGFQVAEVAEAGPGTVEGHTVGELLELSGETTIDLLKIDIEGTELELFSAPDTSWIDRTRVIVIEVHGDDAEKAVQTAMSRRSFTCGMKGEKLVFTNCSLTDMMEPCAIRT